MNNRTKLIVSLLFIVLIILAVAITRFYLNGDNNPDINGGNADSEKIIAVNEQGFSIFSDANGLYGVSESGRILAASEWNSLEFAGENVCIASKKTSDGLKYGCIDFDGNITVPLIYSGIEKKIAAEKDFYCASVKDDSNIVLYDGNFVPCFSNVWNSCTFSGNEIRLVDESGSYSYEVSESGLFFRSANLLGEIADKPYELNIYSRVLLSKLTPVMIEKMVRFTDSYISYAVNDDNAFMNEPGVDLWQFKKLFQNSKEVSRTELEAIPEIHIYNVGSEDGISVFDVSVSADVKISYATEEDVPQTMDTTVKAAVRFRGNYETDLEAVSGSFEPQSPEYPQEETIAE
ncbi:MAG: hypothetical protein IKV85_01380 [Ruminococcus sp.]|nr:hypothetical protein [Ruminococcus sp.]